MLAAFIFNKKVYKVKTKINRVLFLILFSKNKISNYLNYIIKKIYINKRLVV